MASLRHDDFSILSSNCLGGEVYRYFALPYRTPTVGLFFFGEDYIRFVEDLPRHLTQPLSFAKRSRYDAINELRARRALTYPIGLLNGMEIQFLHYESETAAREKWTRRCARVNLGNLFLLYNDMDGFQEEYFTRFEKLDYSRKIFLSARHRPSPCCIHVREYDGQPCIGDLLKEHYLPRYLDMVQWLNEGLIRPVAGGNGRSAFR
jgi:uncharacterized protein (DUF1919 family)